MVYSLPPTGTRERAPDAIHTAYRAVRADPVCVQPRNNDHGTNRYTPAHGYDTGSRANGCPH